MPGPIVHNETTATNLGGFVTVLANLTRRAYALEEPPEYVVYQGLMSGESHQFWATVHIYGRGLSPERPYRFTGRTTSFEPQAIQLAAREAIVQLRHLSPRVNCRSFYYYPSRDGYGRTPQVANGDRETGPALLHLVRYVSALEELFDQITLDLIAARGELVRRAPARGEDEPDTVNPVVLFGQPIESLRSAPTIDQNTLVSPEVLRRLLGTHSNGIVANNPRDGHHRYPDPAAPQPHPANSDGGTRGEASMSTRPARLDINEVD
ncbi:unnamed protein product [Triticum aestivum]|uniref:Uncharacterized protein n=1 Tax=Triticum aestivum TaxID=4565 RepID=A0A7H4LH94_WHEAT|nr:unnamed protein product [Triticum aestivum]